MSTSLLQLDPNTVTTQSDLCPADTLAA
jgi:hypothetical protein